jgi:hypothetical protein
MSPQQDDEYWAAFTKNTIIAGLACAVLFSAFNYFILREPADLAIYNGVFIGFILGGVLGWRQTQRNTKK